MKQGRKKNNVKFCFDLELYLFYRISERRKEVRGSYAVALISIFSGPPLEILYRQKPQWQCQPPLLTKSMLCLSTKQVYENANWNLWIGVDYLKVEGLHLWPNVGSIVMSFLQTSGIYTFSPMCRPNSRCKSKKHLRRECRGWSFA